jgi:hypothetical protein
LNKFAEQISHEFPEVNIPVFCKGSPRIVAYKELATTSLHQKTAVIILVQFV